MTEGVICQRIPVQNSFIHKPSSKLQFHTRWVFYKAKRKAIIGSKLQLKCKELLYSSLADISFRQYSLHIGWRFDLSVSEQNVIK